MNADLTPEQQHTAIRELLTSPGWKVVRSYLEDRRAAILVQLDDARVSVGAMRKLVGELMATEHFLEGPDFLVTVTGPISSTPPDASEGELVSRAHEPDLT